jgi:putative DNA primase/helicase
MNKDFILSQLNLRTFYYDLIPSLKINGKNKAVGLCPFHNDHDPSLKIDLNTGKWYCFPCGKGGDVFKFYMKLKRVDFLTAVKEIAEMYGITEEKIKQKVVATFYYHDKNGKVLYNRERVEPGRNGKKKEFFPKHLNGDKWILGRGCDAVLYNLPAVIKSQYVIIVEGEAKADLLNKWGFVATCLDCGTGSNWREEYTEILSSKKKVIILPDNDEVGRKYALMIANELYGKVKELKVVELSGLPDKGDIIDWAKIEGNDKNKIIKIVKNAPEWVPEKDNDTEGTWEEPIRFGLLETPEIPADILPSWLGDFAGAVSKYTQTPPAMAVMLALSVVATCIQKRFIVEAYNDNGYKEPLNIWTISISPPGTLKSPVFAEMTRPLLNWERDQYEQLREEISEINRNRAIDLKRVKLLEDKAAKEDDSNEREIIKRDIAKILDNLPEEKKFPQLLTDDITPEALQNLMEDHGERMSILSSEGGIFENMAGLYSKGKANFDIHLKGHSGDAVRVNRQGRTASMNNPALTFGITVQPAVISDLSSKDKKIFRGKGLLARFLYVMPKNTVGYRDVTQNNPIPDSVKMRYESGIYKLLDIQLGCEGIDFETPKIITLSSEAFGLWIEFRKNVEVNLRDGGELDAIGDWGGKFHGTALRIAGLMHVAEYGANNLIINRETMERSLLLCELLIEHTLAAFCHMSDDKATLDAKYILRWILRDERICFTRNECHKSSTGRFKDVTQVKDALKILTDRHIISVPDNKPKGRGRPSIVFYVNPKILEGED